MKNEHSPIAAIRQKELEIADRLVAAKEEAEQAIKTAHEWVIAYCRQAEIESEREADRFYQTGLAAADAEAQKIREEGELVANRITEHGVLIKDEAIEHILKIILPKVNDG